LRRLSCIFAAKNNMRYIHQQKNWANFSWDNNVLITPLSKARYLQGKLISQMAMLGFAFKQEAFLETLTLDVVKSNEIEGQWLQPEQVRSSIARQLGMDIHGLIPSDRHVEGVVQMMLDATQKSQKLLTSERLWDWHAALFPTGRSGMYKIAVAQWRKDETGPMQVVSGALGREQVHFEAPAANRLDDEMTLFLHWFNAEQPIDPMLKAGIAHLWFVTIHPFDDGNGRIARAIADMQLSKADGVLQRFYSMSAQIQLQRKQYYDILEKTQSGDLDITEWLLWFLECLTNAFAASELILSRVLQKARFWDKHATTLLNQRQILMLNKLLGVFEGKLTAMKWAKMTKCSNDTALRDIQDLIQKGVLKKDDAGGRTTNYLLILES
jgi:Fic family protein